MANFRRQKQSILVLLGVNKIFSEAFVKPQNLLIIMSDQHNRKSLGCYGHPLVKTPNLDRLAGRGTVFKNAYCNSPICVPARASFATGHYVHDIGYWDNARPYEGSIPSWGHRLAHHGHNVESIGKLHYRAEQDPTGFDKQHIPMHVVGGAGDLLGSLRDGTALLAKYRGYHDDAGPGESSYTEYDRNITKHAVDWLNNKGSQPDSKPWVGFVSLVCPHPPLQSPQAFYDMYPPDDMPWPIHHDIGDRSEHPAIVDVRKFHGINESLSDDAVRRSVSAYFGLCSYLDASVGKVLDALDENGLTDSTRIIYVSDHGETNGKHGIWGKCNMHEESVGIPMIVAGDGVPEGHVVDTLASLIDIYPTVMDAVGIPKQKDDRYFPGASLFDLANGGDPNRIAFAEFHAAASNTGNFMIRKGDMKFVYYVGYPNQLFDLANDPEELKDVADDANYLSVREEMEVLLRSIVDPELVDARAKADQATRIVAHGGRKAILNKGSFGATPAPGEAVVFK